MRTEILIEFQVEDRGKVWLYRAMRGRDGVCRFERKSLEAIRYKTFMWGGGPEGIASHYRAIRWSVQCDLGKKLVNHEHAEAWVAEVEQRRS